MANATPVGVSLRSARKARGLSLNEVASATGISTATLSRIETDKQNVDVALFVSISAVLRVSPADILGNGDGHGSEESLAGALAALSTDQRARVIAAAFQQRAPRRSTEDLHARIDVLLATIDIVRAEVAELQTQVRRRR
jgi:transcriptional regulator with XRE-family HTH domain